MKQLFKLGFKAFIITAAIVLYAAWDTIVFVSEFAAYTLVSCGLLFAATVVVRHMVISYDQVRLSRATTNDAIEASRLGLLDQGVDLAFKMEALPGLVNLLNRGIAIPKEFAGATFQQISNGASKVQQMIAPPLEDEGSRHLLPALRHCDNILVVGGKGTGKTTLLQWLEAERMQRGQTVVLDSHATPAQWRGVIIGLGREYEQIKKAMVDLTEMLKKRYQLRDRGDDNFQPVHTFIDEFTLLPRALKETGYDVQHYSIPALTEGRKVGINCVWGIHSDRVKALGMEGAGDLKECFDAIVYLKNVKGERYAICDFGEGKEDVKYTHPGPFVAAPLPIAATSTATSIGTILDGVVADQPQPRPAANYTIKPPTISPSEQAVLDSWDENPGNKSAAFRAYYFAENGKSYDSTPSRAALQLVETVLKKHGVI